MAQLWLKLALGVTLSAGAVGASLAQDNTVTVFAAASLTNALQDIAKDYAKGHQVKVVSSFASSSTLARQIEAGAPADIFISADQKWMDYAADKKAIDAPSRKTLLGNSLVVVAPAKSAQGDIVINRSTDWKSLLKGGRLAVGDPAHVLPGFTPKRHCKNSARGRRSPHSLRLRKMCAARWRWWSATKRRWASCMVLTPWRATV